MYRFAGILLAIGVLVSVMPVRADIFQWEYINPADPSQGKQQSTTLAPDGAGVDAVPGANLSSRNLTMAYLNGAQLTGYRTFDEEGYIWADLSGTNLSKADLSGANFYGARLTDANLTAAEVRGAWLGTGYDSGSLLNGTGITLSQLYSTASYQAHDLSGIALVGDNLAGGNFAGQNLTNASFVGANLMGANFREANLANALFAQTLGVPATLIGADLTAADARGAFDLYATYFFFPLLFSDAIKTNLIWPDGHISGLDLDAAGLLIVRDYDGRPQYGTAYPPIPITIDQHLAMGPGGTLRMVFEADEWNSMISFAPGIPVTLGGTLELTFAADVNLASQVGRTFDLFDWTGVTPTGVVSISSPYTWDLSNLYATGQVTITAIPEPSTLLLFSLALAVCLAMRRLVPQAPVVELSKVKETRPMRLASARYIIISTAAVTGWTSPVFGDLPMTGTYVPELQAVDTLLQNFMLGKLIPGGTIAITHNDKVIYERGIGYSDAASTVPMQETALMRLASVSKPVTASAIHQLAKDGQLNLDAKVFNITGNGGILNITPYNGALGDSRLADITVQQLLEHKGGWNRDTAGDLAFQDVQIATAMGVPSPPGIANSARYILSQPLQFAPGTAYNYSNIGYMFLGMVVEAASGQAYESYVESNVLAPVGIPAWELDAGRTFAADQNSREPFYSDPNIGQNVYNPTGPSVPWPYGGWDHEKALAYAGLISSSKAIALLAQSRIAFGPEIGKLRSDYPTNPEYLWGHLGSLPGTDTLMLQASWKDWTYSILFDRRPPDGSSYSVSLVDPLQSILEGLTTWPAALVYAGDFTNDQWLTLDDVALFTHALALGSETAFTAAYPTARYGAGDFDGNALVNASDAAGFIGALQHAGVPAEYVALVPELPGDYNRDGFVDAADYVVWRKNLGVSINLPNETFSLGLVDQADYDAWRANFGASLGSVSSSALASAERFSGAVPEPSTLLLLVLVSASWRFRRPALCRQSQLLINA